MQITFPTFPPNDAVRKLRHCIVLSLLCAGFLVTQSAKTLALQVVSILVSPSNFLGGGGPNGPVVATCTVIVQRAPGETGEVLVWVTSNNPSNPLEIRGIIPDIPVDIPQFASSGTGDVRAEGVAAVTTVVLTASDASTSVTIRPVYPIALTISPSHVVGKGLEPLSPFVATGTISVNEPPIWNVWFGFHSNDQTGPIPDVGGLPTGSTPILAGQTSAHFDIRAVSVLSSTTVTISGSSDEAAPPTLYAQITVDPTSKVASPGNPPGSGPPISLFCDSSLSGTINASTGNVHLAKSDPVATRGWPLICNVHLDSQAVEAGRTMGNATFTYDLHVTTQQFTPITGPAGVHWFVVDGDGTRLDFGLASAAPAPTAGIFSQLTTTANGYQLSNAGPPESLGSAGDFTYQYDGNGRLTQIIDPAANVQSLSYDGSGHLLTVVDVSSQKQITFVYSGSLISQVVQNGGGAITNLSYTSGRLTGISVSNAGMGTANYVAFGYDANGLLTSVTRDNDPQSAENFTYTDYASTDSVSTVKMANATDAERSTNIAWGLAGGAGAAERVSVTNMKGGVTLLDFDASGNLIRTSGPALTGAAQPTTYTMQYNASLLPTSVSDGTNTTLLSYTANGLMNQLTNPLGAIWSYGYAGADPISTQDPIQATTGWAYGDANQPHVPTGITDADGKVWIIGHNAYGQPTSVSPPAGSPIGATTVTFDETPNSPTLGYPLQALDGNANRVTFDAYSALGDLLQVSTYPINGNTQTRNTTLFAYDAAQRTTGVQHPDGHAYQWFYAGRNLDHTIDEAGIQYNYAYCPTCGALEAVTGPLGWSLHWTDDGDRDITAFTDARGKVTQYTYGQGRELTRTTYPDNSTLNYLYDDLSRVRQVTNGRGQQIVPGYDAASRMHTLAFPTTGRPTFQFDYNADNTVQRVTDASGITTYTYTPSALVQSVSYDFSTSGLTPVQRLDYAYYPDGSKQSVTWKNGATVVGTWSYSYDAGGRLTSVINPWNQTTSWTYDGEGKLKTQVNSNSTSVTYAYNESRGWPTSITYKKGAATTYSYSLTYDGGLNTVGNLTRVTDFDGSITNFGYDTLYRLTSDSRTGSNPFSHTYGYDLAGNLTTVNGSNFGSYDNANKMTPSGGTSSHDGDGNMTAVSASTIPAGTFAWDDLSNITGQTFNGVTVNYGYNAGGQRMWAQLSGGVRKWIVFDGDLALGDVRATGPAVAWTWGAAGLISQRMIGTNTTVWYQFGPQGETRQLTNSSGNPVDTYIYSPYGVPIATAGTDWNPFRFGGQFGYYTDTNTNGSLILCGARWYYPKAGRWLSRDPVGYDGGANLYAYCESDPVNSVDPSGHNIPSHSTLPDLSRPEFDDRLRWPPRQERALGMAPDPEFVGAIFKLGRLAGRAATIRRAASASKSSIRCVVETDAQKIARLTQEAEKTYPKLKGGTPHDHHIDPKYLGGDPKGATATLKPAYHQLITNEFRRLVPYGGKKLDATERAIIAKKVYGKYPLP